MVVGPAERAGRPFRDRIDAGETLATALAGYADRSDVLVLALPRGGVPVARVIADRLHLPLDLCLVRKLGVPGHEEFAFGALAVGGTRVLNEEMIRALQLSSATIERVTAAERRELDRRTQAYRGDAPLPWVNGRTVILVDDGLATGSTMIAAVATLRRRGAARIVVAVPVGAPQVVDALRPMADEVVCTLTAEPLYAVGAWYEDFSELTDTDVRNALAGAGSRDGLV